MLKLTKKVFDFVSWFFLGYITFSFLIYGYNDIINTSARVLIRQSYELREMKKCAAFLEIYKDVYYFHNINKIKENFLLAKKTDDMILRINLLKERYYTPEKAAKKTRNEINFYRQNLRQTLINQVIDFAEKRELPTFDKIVGTPEPYLGEYISVKDKLIGCIIPSNRILAFDMNVFRDL